MTWELKAELKETLKKEQGCCRHPLGGRDRFALVYPNSYHVGMSNLGFHIVYDLLNRRNDTACERVFLPDSKLMERYAKTSTPIMSLETQSPLYEFAMIGFAISFEMDYFNVLKILEMGKVRLIAKERREMDPIVIAGGPCATFNPEPLSLFFDAFIIGEGEAILPEFMDVYHQARLEGVSRDELLHRMAKIPGVYVPSLYEHCYNENGQISEIISIDNTPLEVKRQWVRNLDEYPAHTVVHTEDTEFQLYLIETSRGCGRHCRFCMAGYCFRKPRNRSLSVLKEEVKKAIPYGKRIGLMGAAISDYPEINELCRYILDVGLDMSVASFRADSVTKELVQALAASGLKTLTLAPEAGSEKIRSVINKGIHEEHLFQAMDLGIEAGIQNFRMYIMIGLPFEQEEDIAAIVDLAGRLQEHMREKGCKGLLTLSINPFVPKPFTPFQWLPMASKEKIEKSLKFIKDAFKKSKHVRIIAESPREACVQAVLARGDRRISKVLLKAHEKGGSKAWNQAMKSEGLSASDYIYRMREKNEVFPWACLNMGVRAEYLYLELEKAKALKFTQQCFDGCNRCGVC